jgi:hypothetical protein
MKPHIGVERNGRGYRKWQQPLEEPPPEVLPHLLSDTADIEFSESAMSASLLSRSSES